MHTKTKQVKDEMGPYTTCAHDITRQHRREEQDIQIDIACRGKCQPEILGVLQLGRHQQEMSMGGGDLDINGRHCRT